MGYHIMQPRFPLGAVFATSGAMELGEDLTPYLRRHHCGDWGVLDDEDKQTNEDALAAGSRILSCYVTERGERLYVITEADRSRTTVLLPSEY
jgi:hypothetical protein